MKANLDRVAFIVLGVVATIYGYFWQAFTIVIVLFASRSAWGVWQVRKTSRATDSFNPPDAQTPEQGAS